MATRPTWCAIPTSCGRILASSLAISGLDAGYGAVRVLHDVSLTVAAGETVALLGTNGNGKSTLLKCVMGIVRPSAGSIVADIDGARHELIGLATEAIVELGIAFVPEGRRLFPKLSVTENLLLGAFRRKARAAIARNLEFCFETFPRLKERSRQLAGSMSGGEQQMLALARALMSAPRILLIDEPSVGLAPLLVARTIDKIKELKDGFQLTVLMAEQNFTQAIRIADRGYVIVHGRIEFEGASAAELNNNELIREFYLGVTRVRHVCPDMCPRRHGGQPAMTVVLLPINAKRSAESGARPRMRSAAFSAIMITAALILPPTRSGITDASTTRSASTPRTRSVPSTTAISSASAPIRQVPSG